MKIWEPLPGLLSVRDEMSRLLDLAWREEADAIVRPRAHLREEAGGYRLEADLPGVRREDIQLDVRDHSLHLAAQRSVGSRTWRYEQTVTLPEPIDATLVSAGMSEGVLQVVIPTQHQPERSIPIGTEPPPTRFIEEAPAAEAPDTKAPIVEDTASEEASATKTPAMGAPAAEPHSAFPDGEARPPRRNTEALHPVNVGADI